VVGVISQRDYLNANDYYPKKIESFTCIPVDLCSVGVSPNARTFALRVRGDSMSGAHILDGDTVVLELKEACHGAIVATSVDGENTLKR
jgi:repressor LexA